MVYPGTCRGLTPAQVAEKSRVKAPAWRIRVPDEEIAFTDLCMGPYRENLLASCGDFYLRRADGVFAYQLAVVVDDARMGVTEVVRGADLLSSTARQIYLYRLLGLTPPAFAHCPLLLDAEGRRLSKRDGDQSLENLRGRYNRPRDHRQAGLSLRPPARARPPHPGQPAARFRLGQGAQTRRPAGAGDVRINKKAARTVQPFSVLMVSLE